MALSSASHSEDQLREVSCPHARSAAEVAAALESDLERGLADAEAKRRLAEVGPNQLSVTSPPGFLQLLLRQFKSFLVAILLVAAVVSLFLCDPQDALVILLVVVVNALIGAFQERRAEQALAALRQMVAPTARVRRDGIEREIPATAVVPGDLVLIRAGDVVPADGRLAAAVALQADESALTGESLPVEKDAGAVLPPDTLIADRTNMLYAGTAITQGHGMMLVTGTGASTELGALARLVSATAPRQTPLEQQVTWLGKVLSVLALAAAAVIFGLGLLRGEGLGQILFVALSLAVAAVPEGLPAVVTIVLALGVQRMARRRAIVRRLAAVEALGAATVICTDKTGTLTLGEMRATVLVLGGERFDVEGGRLRQGGAPRPAEALPALDELLRAAVLCNNSRPEPRPTGDPTEQALLLLARDLGVDPEHERRAWPRLAELPFSSDRKYMATAHRRDSTVTIYVKGAPDIILQQSNHLLEPHGPRPLQPSDLTRIRAQIDALAAQGLRVLALARRSLERIQGPLMLGPETERYLTLLGLVGLHDPPRPEAAPALARAQAAGIRTVMTTGDHPATALAIARQLGLVDEADQHVMTGSQLATLEPDQLAALVNRVAVFARVTPQQKVDIVRAFQQCDEVVAMTGDGANDAPALRLADIGVAMGRRGTAVAREAADMVLADDNYATIVTAVEEGRAIYANLRRSVLYLLSGNLGEILVILLAIVAGLPLPLQAVQILWINLLTDTLPSVGLGVEPPEPGIMARPPRAPGEPFLPRWTAPLVLVPSVLLAFATLAAFVVALARAPGRLDIAQSAAFATLVLAHLGIAWAQRAELTSALRVPLRSNPSLLGSFLFGVASILLLLYTPVGQQWFHTHPLDLPAWGITLALTPLPFIGVEIAKPIARAWRGGRT